MRKRKVLILSIDGGGIRGIIPAVILRALENLAPGKVLCDHFDLISGTSTGALIALGLTVPRLTDETATVKQPVYKASDMVNIYLEYGEKIFPPARMPSLKTMGQAFGEKYDDRGLNETLDDLFGTLTLRDALTNLLVTSCRTETGSPLFFKNRPRKHQWQDDENFFMKDAARASTAAPTYFPPAHIHPLDEEGKPQEKGYTLVDGGLTATNPALCAYIEARKIFPRARKYVVLSLGTGRIHPSYSYDEIKKWGYLDWINPSKGTPLWSLMASSQVESVRHHLYKLPGIDYIRINGDLGTSSPALDDSSPENMDSLIEAGERIVDENRDRLERVAGFLR